MSARLLIFAPNWLGDAVMSLPAIANVRRSLPTATVDIAARPAIAPLFQMVPGVSRFLINGKGRADVARIREGGYDSALLLTNSFNTARLAWQAGIPERWGYRRDLRSMLLTRAVPNPVRVHQTEYYGHLVRALGFPGDTDVPQLDALPESRAASAALLGSEGWDTVTPFVAVASGAAFGGAKRWPAASFAALIDALAGEGVRAVLIGTAADRPAVAEVLAGTQDKTSAINLAGRTDLPTLAGVLVQGRGLVTNDSGAMHLAAALGVNVTALFGPTRERETHPRGPGRHAVLTHAVWCRPCMLRECPLTHRCMTGITPNVVLDATRRLL